jgi:hemerythrin superfamily protein
MDAIAFLKKDHEKVTALFQRFNDGGGLAGVVRRLTGNSASPAQRRSIAEQVCRALDVHAQIEESVFYPAVRALRDERLDQMLDEALREHGTIKDRVEETRLALDDDRLKGAMTSLQQCVEHHVAEEEREMFPKVEERMPQEERSALGRDLAARHRSAGGPTPAAAPTRGRGKAVTRATRRKKSVQRTTTAVARRRVRKTTAKAKSARTTGKTRRAR